MDTGADTAPSALTSTADLVGRRAVRAVFVAFLASGFAFASWASRIPQVRDALRPDARRAWAWSCCALAVGSVDRAAAGRAWSSPASGTAAPSWLMALLAGGRPGRPSRVGYHLGVAPVVVGLFLVGFGNGTWDVAMNVEGAAVEQRLGRSIMPRFHAGFSVGTVAGALLGAAMVALRRLRHRAPRRASRWSSPSPCRCVRGLPAGTAAGAPRRRRPAARTRSRPGPSRARC